LSQIINFELSVDPNWCQLDLKLHTNTKIEIVNMKKDPFLGSFFVTILLAKYLLTNQILCDNFIRYR